jgi:hypothetical protein
MAAIALGQGLLASLEGTAHDLCYGNRSHDCDYAACIDGSEDGLEGFPEFAAFQHIYDGVGIDED